MSTRSPTPFSALATSSVDISMDGEAPFHHYSMRQAIEEKFILDVLKNYVTYEAYFRLVQVGDDDPHVQRKKGARALARTLTFQAVNLRAKTEVMVEHSRTHVKHKICGRAKAMLVTDGRLHAVRYKQSFDNYIAERGYTDVKDACRFHPGGASTRPFPCRRLCSMCNVP